MAAGHFASMEIQAQLDALESLWRQLLDATQLRRDRLQDAYQALLFSRSLDDLDSWMDDVELQLQSEDHGRDLTSVQNLLKKHQILEADINAHSDAIQSIKETAISFREAEHFQAEEIEQRSQGIVKRYSALKDVCQFMLIVVVLKISILARTGSNPPRQLGGRAAPLPVFEGR